LPRRIPDKAAGHGGREPQSQALSAQSAHVWAAERRYRALITVASIKSSAALQDCTLRELGELAKKVCVDNWRSMRKDQLIRTLVRAAAKHSEPKSKTNKKSVTKSTRQSAPRAAKPAVKTIRKHAAHGKPTAKSTSRTRAAKKPSKPAPKPNPRVTRRIQAMNEKREHRLDLSQSLRNGHTDSKNGRTVERDRIGLLVRDSYWLLASWDLTRQSIERARAALAENWHTAKPVLRLFEVDSGPTTSTSERVTRDIEIHGGVRNWYIDVEGPSRSFRVEIGYVSANGKFYSLARSNTVSTPAPGAAEGLDGHWTDVAENCERIYALSGGYSEEHSTGELQEMFEERLRRPMGAPAGTRYGVGAERLLNRNRGFEFEVDAEMIIFGRTKPDAHVTLAGEPVKLREDGSFAVRLGLPDRRQVLPIVASSSDGVEQRTIVLAVERNTKVMEPVIHESNE